jgi:hypothetical protein
MKADLIKWNNLPIHFTGRINLFKMPWLLKFLYLFSVIPITVANTFLNVHSVITDFMGKYNS